MLPLGAYAITGGSAWLAHVDTNAALFLVRAATLLFIFVGIHNAWDTAAYHVFFQRTQQKHAGKLTKPIE